MIEANKSYRISTITGQTKAENIVIQTSLLQDIDSIDILSVSLKSIDAYRKHNANYGVVVGRVIANNGFGIPNAKISIFIEADSADDDIMNYVYPFNSSFAKDENGVRYNLLPDNYVSDCHQVVGTFPNKRFMLDNDVLLEVFDKYYKFTAVTNRSGDYLICGVPVGNHTIHMDLDISDCGILSQRPRDFVYKGYNIEQFENANKFKEGTNYNELSQVFTQDRVVRVEPFWGNSENGETIGITRADIDVAFKFETTCVFMGSIGSDNASQGITEKCVPTAHMGDMDELVSGEGTIEMIRKTPNGKIEEFQIKGNQLINADGVWCYQIPMNLDYVMTDEYGNTVPTDDPNKGVATRAQVRFRISMQDSENAKNDFYRPKVLVPNNPDLNENGSINYDYEFGSFTKDESFRDLFWNNVYSVKSYIPRFQKHKWYKDAWKDEEFSGIKHCNIFGANNPMPYNKIRVKTPFVFLFLCSVIKAFITLVGIINVVIGKIHQFLNWLYDINIHIPVIDKDIRPFSGVKSYYESLNYVIISDSFCPDLEGWFFIPKADRESLIEQTRKYIVKNEKVIIDNTPIQVCVEFDTDYLKTCIELNLANEYRVINFDFYNDWINGFIYIPRIKHYFKVKSRFLGISFGKDKVKGCMSGSRVDDFWNSSRRLTQTCNLNYSKISVKDFSIENSDSTTFHKNVGFVSVFKEDGLCYEKTNSFKQRIYYLKPNEVSGSKKLNLFANDLILIGSLNDCDKYGVPQMFKHLKSTTYILPPNLPITNLEDNTGMLFSVLKETDTSKNKCKTYTQQNDLITIYDEIGDEAKELFDKGENVDNVSLTEIAGIAWNVDGPNQRPEGASTKQYNPGGHFLKMSCWSSNMEVKNKSCINLSRICEIGASMSQRKKDADRIVVTKEGGVEKKRSLKYVNIVPTGFISNSDITDGEVRTMFASMNTNKLFATKLDEATGYKIYDFSYKLPVGFDGVGREITKNVGYNNEIIVKNESSGFSETYETADSSQEENEDAGKTKTKTFEYTVEDYLLFRFGTNKLEDKFLVNWSPSLTQQEYIGMPVYENSFYFYFGLNQGSTALDEFNKQFFSNCESRLIKSNEPGIQCAISNINYVNGAMVFTVNVDVKNVPLPLTEFNCFTKDKRDINTDYLNESLKTGVFEVTGLTCNYYTFECLYGDGMPLSSEIDLSSDLTYTLDKKNFNILIDNNTGIVRDNSGANEKQEEIEKGGYAILSDLRVPFINETMTARISVIDSNNNTIITVDNVDINNEIQNPVYMYFPKPGEYTIQINLNKVPLNKTIKVFINEATCNLYIKSGSQKTNILEVLGNEAFLRVQSWWKRYGYNYVNQKTTFLPYVIDSRPEALKSWFNLMPEPRFVCDNGNKIIVCGFPQKWDYTEDKFKVLGEWSDSELPPNGYDVSLYNNIAGGTVSLEGNQYGQNFYAISVVNSDGSFAWMPTNTVNLILDENAKIDTSNLPSDFVVSECMNCGNIYLTGNNCPLCGSGGRSRPNLFGNYIDINYPCVVCNSKDGYEIVPFPGVNTSFNLQKITSPKGSRVYPMFILPNLNRPRYFEIDIYEWPRRNVDVYTKKLEGEMAEFYLSDVFMAPRMINYKIMNGINDNKIVLEHSSLSNGKKEFINADNRLSLYASHYTTEDSRIALCPTSNYDTQSEGYSLQIDDDIVIDDVSFLGYNNMKLVGRASYYLMGKTDASVKYYKISRNLYSFYPTIELKSKVNDINAFNSYSLQNGVRPSEIIIAMEVNISGNIVDRQSGSTYGFSALMRTGNTLSGIKKYVNKFNEHEYSLSFSGNFNYLQLKSSDTYYGDYFDFFKAVENKMYSPYNMYTIGDNFVYADLSCYYFSAVTQKGIYKWRGGDLDSRGRNSVNTDAESMFWDTYVSVDNNKYLFTSDGFINVNFQLKDNISNKVFTAPFDEISFSRSGRRIIAMDDNDKIRIENGILISKRLLSEFWNRFSDEINDGKVWDGDDLIASGKSGDYDFSYESAIANEEEKVEITDYIREDGYINVDTRFGLGMVLGKQELTYSGDTYTGKINLYRLY